MIWGVIIGAVITIVITLLLYFLFFKKQIEKNSRESFERLASNLFEEKVKSLVKISKDELGGEKTEIKNELDRIVERIEKELKEHGGVYRDLGGKLETHSKIADELKISTTKLNQILGSSKLRGDYGQKITEDILRVCGFIEGTHYIKQKKQETVSTMPDFTFLLPDGFKINMDTKFPFDNWKKMKEAENLEKEQEVKYYKKQFETNIKGKIKEVTSRDYINPIENTLDYVMLFIPNEGIASFIHESFPEIFDLALNNKVVLVSPYQLFGFISIIRQAFQNFYYNKRIKTILGLMGEFAIRYNLFKERFLGIKDKIEKIESAYEDVGKSFKNIDSTVKKIEKHKKGYSIKEIEDEEDSIEPKLLDKPEE